MALTYDGQGPDLSAYLQPCPDGADAFDVLVGGAYCAACMAKIEGGVRALPGVDGARLNLTTGKLAVRFRPGAEADPNAVLATVESLGYQAAPFDPAAAKEAQDREGKRLALALGVAGFGAGNAMMFSVPLWAGLFGQELGPATKTMMQWWSGLIATPCVLYAGMPFYQSAWRSLRARQANMDVPISIGVLLTLFISFVETILGGRDAYFDAAVSLIFLLLIGRWLDHQLRAKARSAAEDLLALQAPYAIRLDEQEREHRTPLADVAGGDLLIVRPGERIPVDAVVESGQADLDNAMLTGETRPVPVVAGSAVQAGALNLTGVLRLRAAGRSDESAVAAIARLIEAGTQSRSLYVRLADKAAAVYVPVVHTAAALTFAVGWGLGLSPREALLRAVAVLIITCPCALGLAVPAVQINASGGLFRRGVLVKSGAALERLAEVDHVVFDKTGVLTEGRPRPIDADPARVAAAAPLARASVHPLAKALAEAAGPGPVAAEAVEFPGLGVEGLIDGRRARLGRAAFVGSAVSGGAETELWFAFVGEAAERFAFTDNLRADAAETIAALGRRGLTVEILSGDLPGPVERVAAELGVAKWRAALSPEDKAEAIAALAADGRKVLMVGDGLNDAAALARAHAAMAPGSALSATQNAADLVFSGEGLSAVVAAFDTAKGAKTRALENFGFATLYNLVSGPAAMLGLINPFIAALAMSGSSLVVTLNALRLRVGGKLA